MKTLLGLCALVFAGHATAACTVANLNGKYITSSDGTIVGVGLFAAAGGGRVNGDGTANVSLDYTIAGVHFNGDQSLTYTVTDAPDGSGNCIVHVPLNLVLSTLTPTLTVPVPFIGHFGPAGDKVDLIATFPGLTIRGEVERSQP